MSLNFIPTLVLTLLFFAHTSGLDYSDSCSQKIQTLESKLNRVLYILESTFNVKRGFDANYDSTYGMPKRNNGYSQQNNLDKSAKGAAHIQQKTHTKNKGYNEADGYLSANAFQDNGAAIEAFNKDEAYLTNVDDGSVFVKEYTGTRVNDSIVATRRNIVREEQVIEEEFINDAKKENHEGDYNGNEFDVGFKSKQLNGGFNDVNAKTEIEQNRYHNAANEADLYKKGDNYNKDIYNRDEEDKGLYNRESKYYKPEYVGNEKLLFDKYTGKKTKPINQGNNDDIYYEPKYGGHGSEKKYYDKDNKLDENLYKNEFELNDKFGNKIGKEDSFGVKQKLNNNKQFNNGKYVDVEATGFNKNANYRGDYKTNKEQNNKKYRFKNEESVEEIGTPDRFNLAIVNDNRVEFTGKEIKSNVNKDRKQGQYTDKEINRKRDKHTKAKAYVGNDLYNEKEKEKEADIYFDTKKDNNVRNKRYNNGYRNGGKYGYYN